jgi:hypothetical protein
MRKLAIALTVLLLAVPRLAIAQECEPLQGKPYTLTGKVTDTDAADGKAVYDLYLEDDQTPCFTNSFEFDDPNGKLKCASGQMLTGTGILAYDANQMNVTIIGTDYSCK